MPVQLCDLPLQVPARSPPVGSSNGSETIRTARDQRRSTADDAPASKSDMQMVCKRWRIIPLTQIYNDLRGSPGSAFPASRSSSRSTRFPKMSVRTSRSGRSAMSCGRIRALLQHDPLRRSDPMKADLSDRCCRTPEIVGQERRSGQPIGDHDDATGDYILRSTHGLRAIDTVAGMRIGPLWQVAVIIG